MTRRVIGSSLEKVGAGVDKVQAVVRDAASTLTGNARETAGYLVDHVPGETKLRRLASGLISIVNPARPEATDEEDPLTQLVKQMAELEFESQGNIPHHPELVWSYLPTDKTGPEHRSPWVKTDENEWLQIGFTELPRKLWVELDFPPVENLRRMFAITRTNMPKGKRSDVIEGNYTTIELQPPAQQSPESKQSEEVPFIIDSEAVEQVQARVAQYATLVSRAR